jgi:hypothetical protein
MSSGSGRLKVALRQFGLRNDRLSPARARLKLVAQRHQRMPQIQQRFAELRIGLERRLIEHRGVSRLTAPLADQTGIVEQLRATVARIQQLPVNLESLIVFLVFERQRRQAAQRFFGIGAGRS